MLEIEIKKRSRAVNDFTVKLTVALTAATFALFFLLLSLTDRLGVSVVTAFTVFCFCEWFELAIAGRKRNAYDYGRDEEERAD